MAFFIAFESIHLLGIFMILTLSIHERDLSLFIQVFFHELHLFLIYKGFGIFCYIFKEELYVEDTMSVVFLKPHILISQTGNIKYDVTDFCLVFCCFYI